MNQNKLVQFYQELLVSLNLVPDQKGLLSLNLGGETTPFTVTGKRLVLPTNEILREGNWQTQIGFHPLSENLVRGQSPVLQKLRSTVLYRIHSTIVELMVGLTTLASNKTLHSTVSPANADLLRYMPDVDEDTPKALMRVIETMTLDSDNALIKIYLRRGACTIRGQNFNRATIVSFPIVTELAKPGNEIYGVKMRKGDKEAIAALFKWLLPDSDVIDQYSAGSLAMVAPWFDSLMRAYIKLAKTLNSVTRRYTNNLDNANEIMIPIEWESHLDHLAQYRDLIPVLEGNEGEITNAPNAPAEAAKLTALGQSLATSQAPVATPAPVVQPASMPAPVMMPPMMGMQPTPTMVSQQVQQPAQPQTFNKLGAGTINLSTGAPTAQPSPTTDEWTAFIDNRTMATQGPTYQVYGQPSTMGMPQQPPMPMNPMAFAMQYPGMPMNPAMMPPQPQVYGQQPQVYGQPQMPMNPAMMPGYGYPNQMPMNPAMYANPAMMMAYGMPPQRQSLVPGYR